MAELAEFERQIDQIIDAIPQLHRDAQVALLLVGYEDVIRRSPVLTGAYRASHTLASGEGRPGTFLYESPSRPDPERGIRRDVGSVLEAPSVGDAKASVADVAPFQTLWIYNPIFYAGFLEFGTSRMAPRRIYGLAADRLDALAAGLKLELPAQIAA